MKIIEGFDSAKSVLSRQVPLESYPDLEVGVRQIISDVRSKGDAALLDYTRRFDGVELSALEVTKKQIESAYREVDSELLSALKLAAERIRSFHLAQKQAIWHGVDKAGSSQLIRPLERVGVYVPGGTASYPSTVLMTAIPASVAGVKEIILVTPPREQGMVPAPTLVAADIAQVDRIFCVGGAQAIAGMYISILERTLPLVDTQKTLEARKILLKAARSFCKKGSGNSRAILAKITTI